MQRWVSRARGASPRADHNHVVGLRSGAGSRELSRRWLSLCFRFRCRNRRAQTFRGREPVCWRERDPPYIAGDFQLDADLEQLAHGSRTLDPCNASTHDAGVALGLGMRHLERHPHIFQDVVLGLVPAAVAVNNERGSSFLERPPERIHASYSERNGLDNARAPPLAKIRLLMWGGLSHCFPPESSN